MAEPKLFNYEARIVWTGNLGAGTSGYRDYSRDHDILIPGRPPLPASSEPAFRGDPTRHNPENMLLAALSSCHMLWYLHLCSVAGVTVVRYEDNATAIMALDAGGGGRFTSAALNPQVTISNAKDRRKAEELHKAAHEKCFIANSVNFPVNCKPQITAAAP
jgi:organic hydroperoxide reductase OsmC/OhrA